MSLDSSWDVRCSSFASTRAMRCSSLNGIYDNYLLGDGDYPLTVFGKPSSPATRTIARGSYAY
jgi:hypothetical protein